MKGEQLLKDISYLKILLFFLISAILTGLIAVCFGALNLPSKTVSASSSETPSHYTTVIIDAGHGGEDGGASSACGLVEKEINLDISQTLSDMLTASGIKVVMTRTDDRLLYDRNVDYNGRKKKLDLAARVAIANSTPDAIFVSIHMNSFTDSKYSGMQIWYSPNNPLSETLANSIRTQNQSLLQPTNNRRTFRATSAINILYNAECPAVLVECGFLSNPSEAEKFKSDEYRKKVAFVIFCSIMDFLNAENNKMS